MADKFTLKKNRSSAKDILTRKPKKKKTDTFVAFIPSDGELTVQFLADPFEWVPFFEVYLPPSDGKKGQYILLEHDDDAWDDIEEEYGRKPTTRFLAPALDVKEARPIAIKVPQSLVKDIMEYAERKKAEVTDFTFELYRVGEGKETRYKFDPERSGVDISRFEAPDLNKVLDQLLNPPSEDELDDDAIEDDTTEEAPAKPVLKRKLNLKK